MDRGLLKQSIDEWHEFYSKARNLLFEREGKPPMPSNDMAVAIVGLRRAGKTFFTFQMSKEFDSAQVLYYNFEDPLFYLDNSLQNLNLLLSVAQEFRSKPIELLILDEIHVVDGWERWLRTLIDQKKFKIIVTGSSAKMLSSEIATTLTGRALQFNVWPLSFSEIAKIKQININNRYENLSLLREMLEWGGLPEVIKLSAEERPRLLKQYLSDIVLKDVVSRNQIRNKRALDQIITYYLTNLSSLHSYTALAKAFGFDAVTASDYTMMLSDAFLVSEVYRYHHNLKTQSRDPKKVYIGDVGFRKVGARSISDDVGKLLENTIYLELLRREKIVTYYKGNQEVDFVVNENYKPEEVIQVCASDMREADTWERELNATVECAQALGLSSATIISHDREENLTQDRIQIKILPAYRWLIKMSK